MNPTIKDFNETCFDDSAWQGAESYAHAHIEEIDPVQARLLRGEQLSLRGINASADLAKLVLDMHRAAGYSINTR